MTRSNANLPSPDTGDTTLDTFVRYLASKTDKPRLDKALKMLKADRFQLYSQTEERQVTGVVKSQTNPALVYACSLSAAGYFSCCTQNLNSCGGLRGKPCKHILVLLIGLVKSGELDAGDVRAWIRNSSGRLPKLDKDRHAEILLRYKGAEAGEVDWRPTETMPEDYYAF